MAKKSKDPFEVFKQATLGSGSPLKEIKAKEPDKTSFLYWAERYYALLERLISVLDSRMEERSSLIRQIKDSSAGSQPKMLEQDVIN